MTGAGDFTGDKCDVLIGIAPSGDLDAARWRSSCTRWVPCSDADRNRGSRASRASPWPGLQLAMDSPISGRRMRRGLKASSAEPAVAQSRTRRSRTRGWNSMQNIVGARHAVSPPSHHHVGVDHRRHVRRIPDRQGHEPGPLGMPRQCCRQLSWTGISVGCRLSQSVTDIIGVGDLNGNGYQDLIALSSAGKSGSTQATVNWTTRPDKRSRWTGVPLARCCTAGISAAMRLSGARRCSHRSGIG